MANNKQRYVNTRFWNDGYVSTLDPIEKLLFIYFLTNEHTNISGIYEIPTKIIAIETGIDSSMINKVMPRLSTKIRYVDGYVIIKNFIKHQETGSDKVRIGIINCLKDLKLEWLESIVNKGYYLLSQYYIDTLSIQYAKGSNYSNLDLDSNSDSIQGSDGQPKVNQKATKNDNKSYGELENVKLTEEEYSKLLSKLGENSVVELIFELDTYIGSKGVRYKSHYATLLNWAKMKHDKKQK